MTIIDYIENRINLTEETIDVNSLIDDYLNEADYDDNTDYMNLSNNYDDVKTENNHETRLYIAEKLLYRFKEIYKMDVISFDNGFTTIIVNQKSLYQNKIVVHRFLTVKSIEGGSHSNVDGSDKLFEKISALSAKSFIGYDSKIIYTGQGTGRLTQDRLSNICNEMKEPKGIFDNLPSEAKDDGVDFIIFKEIDSRNLGNIILLGQSFSGKNIKNKKVQNQRWLKEYILYHVKSIHCALFIVHYFETCSLKRAQSDFENTFVFDRGRILRYYPDTDELTSEILDYLIKIEK